MGWQTKKLGDLLSLEYGKPLEKTLRKTDGLYPAYGANGIKARTDEYFYDQRTIIIGRKGSAGELTLSEEKFWPLDVTYFVKFDEKRIDLFFLYRLLQTLNLPRLATGVKPGINRNSVYELEVSIPPLAKQKQIVAILDEAFANIDRVRQLAERNLNNARELFDSTLNQIFTQRGEGWKSEKFGNVCEFVRGPFGGSLKKNIFKPDGYAVYEQQHAINNQFTSIRYFIDEEKFNEMRRFELLPGDLIMSCSGTMGKIAIIPESIKPGIINQALLKLTPSKSINRNFLKLWMQSNDFQHKIDALAQGVAIQNMASVKILKMIDVPIVSSDDQVKIVERLDKLWDETKELELIYQRKIINLDELKQSLLQKAFRGELTREQVAA